MAISISNRILSPEWIANTLSGASIEPTPLLDLIIPQSKRQTQQSRMIGVDVSAGSVVNAPVIGDNAPAYPIDADSTSVKWFKPACLDLSSVITASELQELFSIENAPIDDEVGKRVIKMNNIARRTHQAMLSQALKGSYAYPKANSFGQIVTDANSYGTVQAPAGISNYLDNASAELSWLDAFWNASVAAIQSGSNNRFGNNPNRLVVLCGADVWASILNLVRDGYPNNPPMPVFENGLQVLRVGVQTYVYAQWSYNVFTTSGANLSTPFIALKNWTMVDLDGDHMLRWLSVDDIAAGLRAMPAFVKTIVKDNPSALEVLFKSTPFVFADVRAIATDVVLT